MPSKQPGHEGYPAFVCDMHDQHLSEVAIVEAEHIERAPSRGSRCPSDCVCKFIATGFFLQNCLQTDEFRV
jgi:hypothetical protein